MNHATTQPMKNDFLKPLLDMMNRRMDDLATKLDSNTALTQQALDEIRATNSKVDQHDHSINALQRAIQRKERSIGRKLDLNPSIVYLIALGAVILLLTIASLLHVNLGGLFK
jgi:hypothetical protein